MKAIKTFDQASSRKNRLTETDQESKPTGIRLWEAEKD
jgi:hypothetical protein